MKLIYDEELTKSVVEKYYKKYEDIDGQFEIKCGSKKISMGGRFYVSQEVPCISFRLKGTMEVEGEKHPVEVAVSESDVENAFITMIGETGRKVKHISINFNEKTFKEVVVDATAKRKVK